MNKLLRFLLLFLISYSSFFYAHNELKIYRSKVTKGQVAGVITLGTFFSLFGAGVVTAGICGADNPSTFITGSVAGTFLTAFGITYTAASLKSLSKWHHKKDKPILIFDEEGFTYETYMGIFSERKNIRYLWKDVIATWEHTTINQYGSELEKYWCYNIKGEKKIIRINVHELHIPEEIAATVEAVRRGFINALRA